MQPQYNDQAVTAEAKEVTDPDLRRQWLNKQFARLSSALRGPHAIARDSTPAMVINPGLADLTIVTLTANTTITLQTDQIRAGTEGSIEILITSVAPTATVTWANAYFTWGTPPRTTTRMIVRFMFDGAQWVQTGGADDDAKGTFGPTVTFVTPGNVAVTYGPNNFGRYTRINNVVHWVIDVDATIITHTTASGLLEIFGLPFSCVQVAAGHFAYIGVGLVYPAGFTFAAPINGTGAPGTQLYIEFHKANAASVTADTAAIVSGTGLRLQLSGTYLI